MLYMKKIFNSILLLIFLFTVSSTFVFAETRGNYFIVTAYYSPLSNQNYYLKWNYEDELRLNWMWIAWASGKWVFSWMLAAPKNYNFWTKIYLEWLWIWTVEDRWWAIVNAWVRWYEYDRIDVWMWYWDDGLRRALAWWKRKVIWNIIPKTSNNTINLKNIPAPMWATQNLKKIPNIFNIWLWKKSDAWFVLKLQKFLEEIWIYTWKQDWIYNNEIIDLVYDFQIENKLINPWELYWAWYWWNQTRNLFLKKYLDWDFDIDKQKEDEENELQEWVEEDIIENNTEIDFKIFETFIKSYDEVIKLQELMIELSLYNWKLTWNYKDLIDDIFDYQVREWILKYVYDLWAWNYWPKTRSALKNTYELYRDNIEEQRREELAEEEEKIRLEEEKIEEEQRKKDLEEKFKTLDELAFKKANDDLINIWIHNLWDVSQSVRNLQLQLKELWHFDYKDTAIYWEKTSDSVLAFQIDNWLIRNQDDLWAWIFWPKTKQAMLNVLKNNYLEEFIIEENLNKKDLADIWVLSI